MAEKKEDMASCICNFSFSHRSFRMNLYKPTNLIKLNQGGIK